MDTGTWDLIIGAAAAAALGSATGVLIIATTAASGIFWMLVGAAARSGTVCNCWHSILCWFGSDVSTLQIHGFLDLSRFNILSISIFWLIKTCLLELTIEHMILVLILELWSMWKSKLDCNCMRTRFFVRVEIVMYILCFLCQCQSKYSIGEVASGVRVG